MKFRKKAMVATTVFAVLFSTNSCLLGEHDSSVVLSLSNVTDKEVQIISFPSTSLQYYGTIDTITLPPHESYKRNDGGIGGGCGRPTFTFFFYKPNSSVDSVVFIFNNERKIVFITNEKYPTKLDDFWTIEGRSEEVCLEKKWKRYSAYRLTYFFTDEMYEQAEPICR